MKFQDVTLLYPHFCKLLLWSLTNEGNLAILIRISSKPQGWLFERTPYSFVWKGIQTRGTPQLPCWGAYVQDSGGQAEEEIFFFFSCITWKRRHSVEFFRCPLIWYFTCTFYKINSTGKIHRGLRGVLFSLRKYFNHGTGNKNPQISLYSPSQVNLNFIKTEGFFFEEIVMVVGTLFLKYSLHIMWVQVLKRTVSSIN